MEFLEHFGKTIEGRVIVFDIYSFNSLFSLLLAEEFSHDDALSFVLAECDLNAYVFQHCIQNEQYLKIQSAIIDFREAGRRSILHQLALSYLQM